MTIKFKPKVHIPVKKDLGFTNGLGILFPDLTYTADDFVQTKDTTKFTLNDEQGWIADYETESKLFLVDIISSDELTQTV